MAAEGMIAEAIHLFTTSLAFGAEGRARKGLTVHREAQRNLSAGNCVESKARPSPAIGGASSQSLACGVEQASIRLLLRTLDLAISFWNMTSCRSLDNSCCTERCVDKSARSCPKLVAVS